MTVGTTLFNRNYALLIGPKYTGNQGDANGILIRDLRLQFSVEQTIEPQPNTATLEIYNLSSSSRSLVENAANKVLPGVKLTNQPTIVLNVGYGLDNPQLKNVFTGDSARVTTKRIGTDIITSIEAGDGEVAYSQGRVDASFAPGVRFGSVLDTIIQAIGINKGQVKGVNLNDQFLQGLSLSGPARNHLNTLLARQGLTWSIQNNQLQVIPVGGNTDEEVILLNAGTGLIGTPYKTKVLNQNLLKKKNGKEAEAGVICVSLLNPMIRPGRRILVESEFITGVFKVTKVKHNGDNFGNNWFSEIEAK